MTRQNTAPQGARNAPIRLVAIDLDGTLLNSQHLISPRTERVLREAMAAGITIVIATGRPRLTSAAVMRQLGLKTPGVFLQGLTVYDGEGNLLHEQQMDVETAQRVADFAEQHGYTVMVYNSRAILTRERNWLTDQMQKYHEPLPEIVGSLSTLPGRVPISKFVFVAEPERLPEIRARLTAHIDGRAAIIQSQAWLLEALPPGTSKGGGLRWLLDHLGVDPAAVMAIGDGENDIEMIELAGIGVAVANATDHLKQVADVVVASNDADGVAEAIERFVLGGETAPGR